MNTVLQFASAELGNILLERDEDELGRSGIYYTIFGVRVGVVFHCEDERDRCYASITKDNVLELLRAWNADAKQKVLG